MLSTEDQKLNQISSRLKKIRLIRGLTQESLAELSNVNIKSIAAYEQNPERLLSASSKTVYRLAEALNCTMEDLLNINLI